MSANRSDSSQGDTGTRNVTYNLISTAYHALQGAETLAMFIADAEQEGNQELSQYFQDLKQQYQTAADRAKDLLGRHLAKSQSQGASGGGGGA